MNDKLWKTLQYSSITTMIIIAVFGLTAFPRERTLDGGWQYYFPNAFLQYSMAVVVVCLLLLFMFSTFVRREEEVSIRVAKKSLSYIVGIGIWYLFIKWVV